MRILGLDEAGRGAVLGPLVVGAFVCDIDQGVLKAAGAADSKTLSPKRRNEVRRALDPLGTGAVIAIEATEIDEGNLNDLELHAFIALIRRFAPDRVYLDAPVPPRGIPAFRKRLIDATGIEDQVVENKADATWPVVGAASIYAKTTRDAAMEAVGSMDPSGSVGSGYPSDPVTRAVLSGLLASGAPMPPWVRTRWSTLDNLRQMPLLPR